VTSYIDQFPEEARLVKAAMVSAFLALAVGATFGLLQVLHRTGMVRVLSSADYYTALTAHGVLLALTFTIFFLVALFTWGITTSLDRNLPSRRFAWGWYGTRVAGALMAVVAIFAGFLTEPPTLLGEELSASVLFTFYAPLQAHPLFYLGLAIFVIGTWIAGYDWFRTYWAWKQDNPGERTPLPAFMALTTMLFWWLSSAGVAIAIVVFLLPWSLGIVDSVNPLLTRTLFWFFGHAVVYFWLMPAYMLWYILLPKLSGGKLFSDPLARVVFVLFLLLSTPTGIHHQYMDPGIAEGFKFIVMVNTMFLLLPSFLTAFTVVASMEHGARQRGGTGKLRWLGKLPWRDPVFTGMALSGLLFAAAGFSGMINAGMNINYLVHNTFWVVGHFHLTVGTAVALTFMAGSYWFIPQVTGKPLWNRTAGLVQVLLWFLGMVFMSNAMHRAGLLGVPRRTAEPQYENFAFEGAIGSVGELDAQVVLGGTLLAISTIVFLVTIVMTMLGDRGEVPDNSYAGTLSGPEHSPAILDNLKLWTAIAFVLIVLAYSLPLAAIVQRGGLFGPGIDGITRVLPPVDMVGTLVEWVVGR